MKFQALMIAVMILMVGLISTAAQGGKAEPKRIQFAAGKSTATLRGTLSNAQEMDYVFYARGGQTVTITNATASLYDFKVYNQDYFDEGDYDSSRSYSFVVPETGDYMLFVRKKQVARPRTARFSITIAIKQDECHRRSGNYEKGFLYQCSFGSLAECLRSGTDGDRHRALKRRFSRTDRGRLGTGNRQI